MSRPYTKRVTTTKPEDARIVAEHLRRRFPWIGTNKAVDYYDECVRLVNFTEALEAVGKQPDPPRKRTLQERRERVTVIAALQFFHAQIGGFDHPEWYPQAERLKGGFLHKSEIEAVVKRMKGEL